MGSTSISYHRNNPIRWLSEISNRFSQIRFFISVLTILGVVGIAWGLRWRALTLLPTDYDEDDYLRAGQEYAQLIRTGNWEGFTETNYRPEHPPLAKILFGISILPLAEKPLILDRPTSAQPDQYVPKDLLHNARIVSALFGTLESLLVAIVNPIAGLALAVHSFTIKYTSQVMLEAFPAFTSMASVLCYVRYKHKEEKNHEYSGMNYWLFLSAISLGITAASKYMYALVGIAILLDWVITGKGKQNKRNIQRIIIWGVIAILVFFIADPYLWHSPLVRLKDSIFFHITYSKSAVEVQRTEWPAWQPLVWLAQSCPWDASIFKVRIDLLIFLFAIIGIPKLWQKEKVYCLWIGVAIIFLLFWSTKWPQYILVLTAPLSLAAAVGLKVVLFEPIKSIFTRIRIRSTRPILSLRETFASLPWLLPGLVTLGVLIVFPLFYQVAISLTDFSGASILDGIRGGIWREVWNGFIGQIKGINFTPLPRSSNFSESVHYIGLKTLRDFFTDRPDLLVFSLIWTVLSVGLQAILGISVALLLNQRWIRFLNIWRTIFLLPWAIPEFVGSVIWLRTFDPMVGWVAQAFGTSGGGGGAILFSKLINSSGPNLAMLLMLISATWIGFPFIMLAASASLKLIPNEVVECASIDGAGSWEQFKFVKWPLLMPLVVPVIIIRAIFAFNQFYLFYVFFPHPRYDWLGTFSYYSYIVFKERSLYSYSAAINIVTVVILIVLLMVFNRWSKAAEGVTYA